MWLWFLKAVMVPPQTAVFWYTNNRRDCLQQLVKGKKPNLGGGRKGYMNSNGQKANSKLCKTGRYCQSTLSCEHAENNSLLTSDRRLDAVKTARGQVWWPIPLMLAPRRWRQRDLYEFEASQGYIVGPYLKTNKKKSPVKDQTSKDRPLNQKLRVHSFQSHSLHYLTNSLSIELANQFL